MLAGLAGLVLEGAGLLVRLHRLGLGLGLFFDRLFDEIVLGRRDDRGAGRLRGERARLLQAVDLLALFDHERLLPADPAIGAHGDRDLVALFQLIAGGCACG